MTSSQYGNISIDQSIQSTKSPSADHHDDRDLKDSSTPGTTSSQPSSTPSTSISTSILEPEQAPSDAPPGLSPEQLTQWGKKVVCSIP